MSFISLLQPFEKCAALMADRLLFVPKPFIPMQHPQGRVASVPRYCNGLYAVILQFFFYCLHQVHCHLTATVRFVHPQRIDESIRFAIQRFVFGVVRNKRLYAAMMLLVGDEYANGVFPMLMLYHSCREPIFKPKRNCRQITPQPSMTSKHESHSRQDVEPTAGCPGL